MGIGRSGPFECSDELGVSSDLYEPGPSWLIAAAEWFVEVVTGCQLHANAPQLVVYWAKPRLLLVIELGVARRV